MVRPMVRTVLAIAVGFVVVLALAAGVEGLSAVAHPFPEGFSGTFEEVCRHVERYPAWFLAAAALLWAGAGLIGVWIAGRIGNRASAAILGLLILAAVIANVSMLPYPLWFKAASVILMAIAAAFGFLRSQRRPEIAAAP